MELKIKNSYSYFIYPYVVEQGKYKKYIQSLLKNSKCTPKIYERQKDLNIYNYFLPTVRDYMFQSFKYAFNGKQESDNIDIQIKQNVLKSIPCTIFEYNIGENVQAKVGTEDGIFFKIEKIEIICFKAGICFLAIKTNIEDTDKFSELLNFNAKFTNTNIKSSKKEKYSNIKIQADTFDDIKKLSEVINEITGKPEDAEKIDIDINKFYTYSFACIDKKSWNENTDISDLQKEFFKFANVLNSDYKSNFPMNRLKIVSVGDYIKFGITGSSANLMASNMVDASEDEISNKFENEYFYTYILALYQKFYFSKIVNDFKKTMKNKKASKEFVDFTNDVWVHEATNDDVGKEIFKNFKEVLDLKKLYSVTKEQYDVTYKSLKTKESDILNKIVLILLAISIITNIVNFINMYKIKG